MRKGFLFSCLFLAALLIIPLAQARAFPPPPHIPQFSWETHITEDSYPGWLDYPLAGDVTGDGMPDILLASWTNDKVYFLERIGDAQQWAWKRVIIDSKIDGPLKAIPADMDLDGDLDVVVPTVHSDQIVWYENDASGEWPRHTIIQTLSIYGYRSTTVADLDNDGYPDIVATIAEQPGPYKLVWLESPGPDFSRPWQMHEISDRTGMSLEAGDIDADGRIDLVGAGIGEVYWFRAPRDPTQPWPVIEIDSHGSFQYFPITDIHLADMNGDNELDIIVSDNLISYQGQYVSYGQYIVWYEQPIEPFSEPWTNHTIEDQLDLVSGISVADINGDGRFEIVASALTGVVGPTEPRLRIYYQPDPTLERWLYEEIDVRALEDFGFFDIQAYDLDMDKDKDIDLLAPFEWYEGGNPFTTVYAYENL